MYYLFLENNTSKLKLKWKTATAYGRASALQPRQSILKSERAALKVDNQQLQHYKEQDDIPESIFDGVYGSELEDQLENELDKKLEIELTIQLAFQKWKECDKMMKKEPELSAIEVRKNQ